MRITSHTINYLLFLLLALTAIVACKDSDDTVQIFIPGSADITEIYDTASINGPVKVPLTLLAGMTIEILRITSDDLIGVFLPEEKLQLEVYQSETVFQDLISPKLGELFFASAGSKIMVPDSASSLFFESVYSEQAMDTLDIRLIPFAGNKDQYKPDSCLPIMTSIVQLEGDSYHEIRPSDLVHGSVVYVETLYEHEPVKDELEIRLTYDLEHHRMLIVYRTFENPNLYRSKSIIFNNPE